MTSLRAYLISRTPPLAPITFGHFLAYPHPPPQKWPTVLVVTFGLLNRPKAQKRNVCDGRFATAPLIYAGSCPKPEFGRFMLENVRNSGVENVRRCRTSSKPKKVQIWHFPRSAFEVGNSPTLMNGVGKCQTVTSSPMVSFYQLENVRRSQIVIWWVCTWWKMSDSHRKSTLCTPQYYVRFSKIPTEMGPFFPRPGR